MLGAVKKFILGKCKQCNQRLTAECPPGGWTKQQNQSPAWPDQPRCSFVLASNQTLAINHWSNHTTVVLQLACEAESMQGQSIGTFCISASATVCLRTFMRSTPFSTLHVAQSCQQLVLVSTRGLQLAALHLMRRQVAGWYLCTHA